MPLDFFILYNLQQKKLKKIRKKERKMKSTKKRAKILKM